MTLDSKIYKTLGVVGAIALVHSLHTVHSKYESYMAERVAYERDQLSSEVKRLEQITDFSALPSDVLLNSRVRRIVKEEVERFNRKPSTKHKVTEEEILRIMVQESSCNMCARSSEQAIGLMQILMSTARSEYRIRNESELFKPETNIRIGVDYFGRMLSRYNGNRQLAHAAYNAGPGAVDSYGGVPDFIETRAYVTALTGRQPQTKISHNDGHGNGSQSRKAIARAEPAKRSKVTASSKKAKARVYALTHYVNQGETLWSISRAYQVPISDIARLNGVNLNYRVRTNQPLKIPTKRRG